MSDKCKTLPPKLTSKEKVLFDEEELLSSHQHIIANSCRRQIHDIQLLLPTHRFCRQGFYPRTSIQRQQIKDEQVLWTIDLSNYNPPYYTDPSLFNHTNEVDPEIISSNFMWNMFDENYGVDRRTANPIGSYRIDSNGYPLNPLGRTGICGRGVLKRWAVNYQTYFVIMCSTNRTIFDKEIFKYIIEKSKTNDYHSLPSIRTIGANLEVLKQTLKGFLLHLYHEWNDCSRNNTDETKLQYMIENLTLVGTAYVDDPKNTDNAWLETTICCYVQIRKDQRIDLNKLFPDHSSYNNSTYTWHHITRTSKLLDSELDIIKLIAQRYKAYW